MWLVWERAEGKGEGNDLKHGVASIMWTQDH